MPTVGVMRTAQIGKVRLVASPIPAGSLLVRIHPDDGPHYDRMIVVTEEDCGRALHLMGWIGDPLLPTEWAAARAALFPKARLVRFERLKGDTLVDHRLLLA